ncbi:hypothetical protein AGMMS50276_14070 [Synergistales bacterium]|nr:hypothetical protein AGMMS50276_14070 [Synergistales bacterium]
MGEEIFQRPSMTLERFLAVMDERLEKSRIESEKESERRMRESEKESERRMAEFEESLKKSREKFDEDLKKSDERFEKELEKSRKEFNKQWGDMGNRLGEIAEATVIAGILPKFQKLGYTFTKAYPDVVITDRQGKALAEADITLENGDFVLLAEVKIKPNIDDVKDHVKRLEIFRDYADERNDRRKFIGALAGGVFLKNVKQYARSQGFYVISQSGDAIQIDENPKDWEPRVW